MLGYGTPAVKMATGSQHLFTVGDIIQANGKTGLVLDINSALGFNQYRCVDVDTGSEFIAYGYQMRKATEFAAAILPNFDDIAEEGDELSVEVQWAPPPEKKSRWAPVVEGDIVELQENRHSTYTKNQTAWATKMFREWLAHEGHDTNFETDPVEILAGKLRIFYASVRGSDGRQYSKSSLVNIRASLNRHLTSPPYNRQINIMRDRDFQEANQVFQGYIRKMRQQGLDRSKHKDAVTSDDMKLMYQTHTLSEDNPVALQRKVYVEISLHFCRRGREGLRELSKDSFREVTDENGRKYITMNYREMEKNHQGLNKSDDPEEPRMYIQDGPNCPVHSFNMYISKLHPDCPAFFQRPNPNFRNSGQWYMNVPVGKNLLAKMMKNISKDAKLSNEYSNHCLRVTAVTVLHQNGVEDSDICTVSRHRNIESLKSYCKGPSDEKRYCMSTMLHEHGHDTDTVALPPKSPQPCTSAQADLEDVRALALKDKECVNPQPDDSEAAVIPSQSRSTAALPYDLSVLSKSVFAGATFQAGCNPVFNINGNIYIQ